MHLVRILLIINVLFCVFRYFLYFIINWIVEIALTSLQDNVLFLFYIFISRRFVHNSYIDIRVTDVALHVLGFIVAQGYK